MIPEFLDFCRKELFPSIDPYTIEGAKNALRQYEDAHRMYGLTKSQIDDDLRQGDVFEGVPFWAVDEKGNMKTAKIKGMLLTNTCDCERNRYLEFAAVLPLSRLAFQNSKILEVKANRFFQYLYVPDNRLVDEYVDFGLIVSLPRELFTENFHKGRINKAATLSWVGYYFFLSKLTVFFMRPEDGEVNDSRDVA